MASLRCKLIDLKKNKEVWNDENLVVDEMTKRKIVRSSSTLLDNEQSSSSKKLPESILISGISGTGKSALVMKGKLHLVCFVLSGRVFICLIFSPLHTLQVLKNQQLSLV